MKNIEKTFIYKYKGHNLNVHYFFGGVTGHNNEPGEGIRFIGEKTLSFINNEMDDEEFDKMSELAFVYAHNKATNLRKGGEA